MIKYDDDSQLLALVEDYSRKYFVHSDDRPIISEPFSSGSFGIKGDWEGTTVSAEPGVYVLFSEAGKALYIGKSSSTIGSRLVRFRRQESNWPEPPATVRLITVKNYYEAPSLEEFLIERIESSFNSAGTGKRPSR